MRPARRLAARAGRVVLYGWSGAPSSCTILQTAAGRLTRGHSHPDRSSTACRYRYPSYLLDVVAAARARTAPGGGQERHGQRGVLPGALSRCAAHAGRADDGGAGAGLDGAAAGARSAGGLRVYLRGVDKAKFRRQVVPGDRLRLEVTLGRRPLAAGARARHRVRRRAGRGRSGPAARAATDSRDRSRAPSFIPAPRSAKGRSVGPYASIGPNVRIGRNCRIGASAVIDGWTEHRRRHAGVPVRLDRPDAAGPEVPRRADAAPGRPAATSSASS